jgi:hypothetical protein
VYRDWLVSVKVKPVGKGVNVLGGRADTETLSSNR